MRAVALLLALIVAGCAVDHLRSDTRRDAAVHDAHCVDPALFLLICATPTSSPHVCMYAECLDDAGQCPDFTGECWCFDTVGQSVDPACRCEPDGWHC